MTWKENKVDNQYLKHVHKIITTGTLKKNRTGVDTIAMFGNSMKFDLSEGFPLLTSKRVFWKSAFSEMLWMISGSTNVNDLPKFAQRIWSPWADKNGSIGKSYGYQMRSIVSYYPNYSLCPSHIQQKLNNEKEINSEWEEITIHEKDLGNGNYGVDYIEYKVDQIKKIQWQLRQDPSNRKIVLDLWNIVDLESMQLEPCHFASVFNVIGDKLNISLHLRSSDSMLGCPYNIAMYALLLTILAHTTGLKVGELQMTMADCHIYENHLPQIHKQITNKTFKLPKLIIKTPEKTCVTQFTWKDFEMEGYEYAEELRGEIAV